MRGNKINAETLYHPFNYKAASKLMLCIITASYISSAYKLFSILDTNTKAWPNGKMQGSSAFLGPQSSKPSFVKATTQMSGGYLQGVAITPYCNLCMVPSITNWPAPAH